MIFEIGFNRKHDKDKKEFYNHIGAKRVEKDQVVFYHINVESLENLEELYNKINLYLTDGKNNYSYDFVINYDPPSIFID